MCKQWCEQEGCTSAWGDKLLAQPAPCLCLSMPHGDSFSGVYDPTWYGKAAALPDGVINNYQMDVRSTSSAHISNRTDKDWIHVFLF